MKQQHTGKLPKVLSHPTPRQSGGMYMQEVCVRGSAKEAQAQVMRVQLATLSDLFVESC